MLAWMTHQLRSAFRILSSVWTDRTSNDESRGSTEGDATPPQTSTLTSENAVQNPDSAMRRNTEKERGGTSHLISHAESLSAQESTLPSSKSDAGLTIPSASLESNPFKPRPAEISPTAFETRSREASVAASTPQPETLAAARAHRETASEQSLNLVSRDELKHELDTLRRLIESRK